VIAWDWEPCEKDGPCPAGTGIGGRVTAFGGYPSAVCTSTQRAASRAMPSVLKRKQRAQRVVLSSFDEVEGSVLIGRSSRGWEACASCLGAARRDTGESSSEKRRSRRRGARLVPHRIYLEWNPSRARAGRPRSDNRRGGRDASAARVSSERRTERGRTGDETFGAPARRPVRQRRPDVERRRRLWSPVRRTLRPRSPPAAARRQWREGLRRGRLARRYQSSRALSSPRRQRPGRTWTPVPSGQLRR
jgi:hypothetical protein